MSAKKSERIAGLVAGLNPHDANAHDTGLDAHYAGYFACFNAGRYYEAHDVLEDLWLRQQGENHAFYKGLIQFAGAFVHLQKQRERPEHPHDGRRLRPAARLFLLAAGNLDAYQPSHLHLDVAALCALCREMARQIEHDDFMVNPWEPTRLPVLRLDLS